MVEIEVKRRELDLFIAIAGWSGSLREFCPVSAVRLTPRRSHTTYIPRHPGGGLNLLTTMHILTPNIYSIGIYQSLDLCPADTERIRVLLISRRRQIPDYSYKASRFRNHAG